MVEYLKCELDLCNLRGQCYDGATVMSGKVHPDSANPASSFVSPLSRSSFEFSFVICRVVQGIRNLFCSIQKISWFLGGSAKRAS